MQFKKISYILCFFIATSAQAQSFKLSTYNEKRWQDPKLKDNWNTAINKPATVFEGYANRGANVYFLLQLGKDIIAAKKPVKIKLRMFQIENGQEKYLYDERFPSQLSKDYTTYFKSGFQVGDYIARLTDEDNEEKIYTSVKFSVKLTADPYNATGKIYLCNDVDNKWKPIGVKTTLKVGECTNLFLAMPTKLEFELTAVGWAFYKVNEDGTESFVDQFQQTVQASHIRYAATTTPLCPFNEKGKYAVYAADWNTVDANRQGNLPQYFAKIYVTVQ